MKKIITALCLVISPVLFAKPRLPKFFSSHMVLQRDTPISIYGWANAGKTVTVNFGNKEQSVKVNPNGEWSTSFPSMPAGGPYEITVSDGEKVSFEDVYTGDVWFCSGQSNMGYRLDNVTNAKEELANATNPMIRLLQVSRTMAGTPQKDIEKGTWETCSPKSSKAFSAVAYFFGKELQEKYKVPIGLINSSWGGTNIEAWMSADVMGNHPEAKKVIEQMKGLDFSTVMSHYDTNLKAWEKKADDTDTGLTEKWFATNYNTKDWKDIELPVYWSKAKIQPNDGVIWVTRTIELTDKDLVADNLQLSIGRVDNEDMTYLNGHEVGKSTNKDMDRLYNVAKENFVVGKNTLTIRVKNVGDIGGFRSFAKDLYLQTATRKISIAGTWKYKAGTPDIEPVPERQHPTKYATSLYNGMVAPFFGIKIKGIIWYQGEANSKNAAEYGNLLKEMATDWRAKWRADYPFIFAQLPNYANQNNRWITLRESQATALSLKNSGMAVLIDVGQDDNIHPANKQEPGRRMALLAENIAYGEKSINAAAPVYKEYKTTKNGIDVLLTAKVATPKSAITGFEIAGKDKKFYTATAQLQPDGKTLKVSNPQVAEPSAVRYLWADAPGKVTLYNEAGMPVAPFRTDNW
jgi:sialate O-acetylesterase